MSISFLVVGIANQTFEINEALSQNDSKSYTFYANEHTVQLMNITGNKFNLSLTSPSPGLQIPLTTHTNPIELSWFHLDDGKSNVTMQNIGDSDLEIDAIFTTSYDVSMSKYVIIVMIFGIAIIGVSTLKFFSTKN